MHTILKSTHTRVRTSFSIGMSLLILLGALLALPATASAAPTVTLPGTIQAENYRDGGSKVGYADTTKGNSGKVYRADDVDVQATNDALTPGGYNVGWVRKGEWLAYDVVVPTAASYTLTLRVATPYSDGKYYVEYNGKNVSGTQAIPRTKGHQNWADVPSKPFNLPAGQGILKLVFLSDGFNLNQFSLTSPTAAVPVVAVPAPAPVEPTPPPAPATPTPAPAPAACPTVYTRVVNVGNTAQLNAALNVVQPGDQIRLANAQYDGRFTVTTSGNAAQPISICGDRGAVLNGGGISGGDVFKLRASYWTVAGFTITNAKRGLVVEGGTYNVLRSLELHTFGQEAMHVHKMSTNNLIDSNWVHDTGKERPEYGEGIYVGTHSGNWARDNGGRVDASDWNIVQNNTLGPNVTAEHVESKEGTTGTLIQGNTFNGEGMLTGLEYVDSWVTVKGNGAVVRDNRGTKAPTHGFRVLGTDIDGWGDNNVFYNNVADVQTGGYGFKISPASVGISGTVVSCNNQVTNAAKGLSDITCTP